MKRFALVVVIASLCLVSCSQATPSPYPTVPASAVPEPSATVRPSRNAETSTPTAQVTLTPSPSPTIQVASDLHLLAGTITGLDQGVRVKLRLEFLLPGDPLALFTKVWPGLPDQVPERGNPVSRFDVTNGSWQAADQTFKAGLYRLSAEAEGYVSIPNSLVFILPEEGVGWRYTNLNFKFLHPADAPARLGIPLCAEPPPHGGEYVIPPAPPSPTPTFSAPLPAGTLYPTPAWPPGTCYAGHFWSWALPSSGLLGRVSGLAPGQMARITIYVLPPAPGENYSSGPPPPPDGSWHYAWAQGPLFAFPTAAPASVLTATMTIGNGSWGLIDPNLRGHKYLVIAEDSGQTLTPAGYEIVLFGGKDVGLSRGLDFTVGTRIPPALLSPVLSPTPFPVRRCASNGLRSNRPSRQQVFISLYPDICPPAFASNGSRIGAISLIWNTTVRVQPVAPGVEGSSSSESASILRAFCRLV